MLELVEKGMAPDSRLARNHVDASLFPLGVEIMEVLRVCFEKINPCWLALSRSWFNIPSDVSTKSPTLGMLG